MRLALMLAQATSTQPAPPGLGFQLMPFLLIGLVIYFLMYRPQKREREQHRRMLDAMKKNDRVLTIGGMMGVVVSLKDDEVVLKVDESNNTRITFVRSAIKSVLSAGAPDEKREKTA